MILLLTHIYANNIVTEVIQSNLTNYIHKQCLETVS